MDPRSLEFRQQSIAALSNPQLQTALGGIKTGWAGSRSRAALAFPDFEGLREQGRCIRDHALANVGTLLEEFERNLQLAGGRVHWARDAAEANEIIAGLCHDEKAKSITKSKSMVAEEIGLNAYLEAQGFQTIETDLGEYIIQIAGQRPSHLVGPAIHMTKDEVADLFARHHGLPRKEEGAELVGEARQILRDYYLNADVGITGANFLVAETGTIITVTNEGNAELTQGLPNRHIVLTGIEKVVPTMREAFVLLRLLARSATGQAFSVYTTAITGPKRKGDLDGPGKLDVVLLDNGRSTMIAGPFREMLRCIRCGACMNHCPVYLAAGGHAYGWVYVGPMGSVLTPNFVGIQAAHTLPNASTFCGKCEEVCPVKIPLPGLMRKLREVQHRGRHNSRTARTLMAAWGFLAVRPPLFRLANRVAGYSMRLASRGRGRADRLLLAGNWTASRSMPCPEGETFMAQWRKRRDPPA